MILAKFGSLVQALVQSAQWAPASERLAFGGSGIGRSSFAPTNPRITIGELRPRFLGRTIHPEQNRYVRPPSGRVEQFERRA